MPQHSSVTRNRDNSSSSMGTRKSLSLQSQAGKQINGYLRTSQQKSVKNGTSRNQPSSIGAPVNTQNTKQ
jgi:hypothetical protein